MLPEITQEARSGDRWQKNWKLKILSDRPGIGLKRNQGVLSLLARSDALGSRQRTGRCGDIGYIIPNGGLADMGGVLLALPTAGSIDQQGHIPTFNTIHQIGASESEFFHQFCVDSIFLQEEVCAPGRKNGEPHLRKQSGRFKNYGFVGVRHGNENVSRKRQCGIGRFLGGKISHPETVGQNQGLAVDRMRSPKRGSVFEKVSKGKTGDRMP